ncbi:hypothetical protein F53441_4243 [Fusarium austroafricanum]|uniref:Uncharacterized protein n=1 Tax=Fusarium austroafricanum TaxID=2364996 RepID=A0A8H4KMI4_9HYPO|nr:hypothetical protein F53441_4243 [Fusarium austroafricanum]
MLLTNTIIAPITALAALLPFAAALPKPAANDDSIPYEIVNAEKGEEVHDTHLTKRWDDGHGPISRSSGYFSVVFVGERPAGPKSKLVIKGEGWEKKANLNCDKEWTSITSPLPWTIDIHTGNACGSYWAVGYAFDNVWIKYSGEFLNVPSETRCGDVGQGNWSRRCIIKA